MKSCRFLIACVAAAFAVSFNASAHDTSSQSDPKIVAYYIAWGPTRGYQATDMDGTLVTHINYAFADIRGGKIVVADPATEITKYDNFGKLRQLKKKHPHLKTLISVGGWSLSKEFSNVALTPATRARFADSGVAFVRKYGFDGVDIDWEFPVSGGAPGNAERPEDKQNYTLLMKALRDKLNAAGKKDRKHYLLTTAIGISPSFLPNTEMDKVAGIVDFVNIMTYDFSGPWSKYAGHLAPLHADPSIARDNAPQLSVSSAVDKTIEAGVPANKLVMGFPMYGYSWKNCGAANHGQHQDCGGKGQGTWEEGALDSSDIQARLVNKNGFTRYWNDVTKTPFVFNAETGEFVSYEDPESFDEKIKFLKSRQLAGAM
ncbi:MAG: chiII, partial [Paucimonas sp.]|nr:chiII [Paucimonas sp.]